MALVSLILVYLVFVCIILGILFLAGVALLITGVVLKRRRRFKGKKSPIVCIIAGSALILPSVAVTLMLIFGTITDSITANADYDSVTDKWRVTHVSDREAADEAIRQLLTAADAGDRETFSKTFTPELQRNESFGAALDAFFKAYPSGLSQCGFEKDNRSSDASYGDGITKRTVSAYYTCFLDDEWYYIGLNICHENEADPDGVGVDSLIILNLEAYALDRDYPSDGYLVCDCAGEDEATARLISGRAFIFEPTPDRVITTAQIKKYLESCDTLDDLTSEIGEPNVSIKYDNCTGYDYYYELASEDGEPRYAMLCVSGETGKLLYGYVCSDREGFYDRKLIINE